MLSSPPYACFVVNIFSLVSALDWGAWLLDGYDAALR